MQITLVSLNSCSPSLGLLPFSYVGSCLLAVCYVRGPQALQPALDDAQQQALQQIMTEQVGTYRSKPIRMPGSFFVNKVLKIGNEAVVHPLRDGVFPYSGETVVTLVGFHMMTITFTGSIRQDGTRCAPLSLVSCVCVQSDA